MAERKRITKLNLNFVSLCELGDNGPAEVVIHKVRQQHNLGGEDSPTTSVVMPNQQPTGRPAEQLLEGLPDEVAKYLTALEDTVIAQEDEIAKMSEGFHKKDDEEDKDEEDMEKVLKSAPPAVAAIIRKQQEAIEATNARLQQAETIAKTEREARIAKEFRDRAASDFAHLGKADEIGTILKAASEKLDDDTFTTLVQVMKRADSGMSALFDEVGVPAGMGESTSLDRLDTAVAKVRAAEPTLSEAELLEKALELDPAAYDAYNADFMRRGGAR